MNQQPASGNYEKLLRSYGGGEFPFRLNARPIRAQIANK